MSASSPPHPSQPARVEFSLRLATAEDALCLGVLATQVFLDTYATQGIRLALCNEVLEMCSTSNTAARLANPARRIIVAEVAGHLVGFAELAIGATHALVGKGGTVELVRIYVQRPFIGKGVGAALMQSAETLAAEHGARKMWLTAWVENDRAIAFYTARGYQDVGAVGFCFQGDEYENRVFAREVAADSSGRN